MKIEEIKKQFFKKCEYQDLDTDEGMKYVWNFIESTISQTRKEIIEEIKKQVKKETLLGGFNWSWRWGKDWIDRKQLLKYLEDLNKK